LCLLYIRDFKLCALRENETIKADVKGMIDAISTAPAQFEFRRDATVGPETPAGGPRSNAADTTTGDSGNVGEEREDEKKMPKKDTEKTEKVAKKSIGCWFFFSFDWAPIV